jgi:hypothetical protein
VKVEVFASDRVLLLPAGIGVRPPASLLDGRITSVPPRQALVRRAVGPHVPLYPSYAFPAGT